MTSDPSPVSMTRRHFLSHNLSVAAMAGSATYFTSTMAANAAQLSKEGRAAILIWLAGGAASIDMWDLKPGTRTGGPFRPIATTGDMQICEHLPKTAKQMQHLSLVRSMSTREADHTRGKYYLHTGFVPSPTTDHPSYGAVVAHQLADTRKSLGIPPFVSVGGGSIGSGFLGMSYAPFVVNDHGRIANMDMNIEPIRVHDRMQLLSVLERGFVEQSQSLLSKEHARILEKTYGLLTSKQMNAFKVEQEPAAVRERYGDSRVGRGCLLARRLVEVGVPFVEIDTGGWDTHSNNFDTLEKRLLPELDTAISALTADLVDRGMQKQVVILCMGEFGRTPTINGSTGRDHWARCWSVLLGGGGLKGGIMVGSTSADGTEATSPTYSSEELMATVLRALDIPLETHLTTRTGRPMKLAGGGKPIKDLLE
jgi:hypothetical protein